MQKSKKENTNKLGKTLSWLIIRTWFISFILLIVLIHWLTVTVVVPQASETINHYASGIFQFVGCLVILWAIINNLGLISKSSIYDLIVRYLKEFPYYKDNRSHALDIHGVEQVQVVSSSRAKFHYNTVDEKIEYLMGEIDRLDHEINRTRTQLKSEISQLDERLQNKIKVTNGNIDKANKELKSHVVGGAKVEIFGLLLVIYGIIIPIIPCFS